MKQMPAWKASSSPLLSATLARKGRLGVTSSEARPRRFVVDAPTSAALPYELRDARRLSRIREKRFDTIKALFGDNQEQLEATYALPKLAER